MKTIVLCASVTAYQKLIEVKQLLENRGFTVLVPDVAEEMEEKNDYTMPTETDEEKLDAIKSHFKKVDQADMLLVINEEKHGIKGYIGPNVLMEMGLALYLNKPIYLWHTASKEQATFDEIRAMKPIVLEENLDLL